MENGLTIDNDRMVAHIVNRTDLLSKFISPCKGSSASEGSGHFMDFCHDYIINETECINELETYGDFGPFSVCTSEYQGIFFAQALDFDDMKFFLNRSDVDLIVNDIVSAYS